MAPGALVMHGLQVLAFTAPGAALFPQCIGDESAAKINADLGKPDDLARKALSEFLEMALKK